MISCPGFLAKLAAGFNGFSHAFMVSRSCWNFSSVMYPDCFVPLEDSSVEGSLVISIDFFVNQNNLTIIPVVLK